MKRDTKKVRLSTVMMLLALWVRRDDTAMFSVRNLWIFLKNPEKCVGKEISSLFTVLAPIQMGTKEKNVENTIPRKTSMIKAGKLKIGWDSMLRMPQKYEVK